MFVASILGPSLMFAAGVALLTFVLMRRTYQKIGRGRKRYDSRALVAQPRPEGKWSGAKGDPMAMIDRQKVELADFSRDVNGQIDSKLQMLRELIARSQQQIDRMEELLAEEKRR